MTENYIKKLQEQKEPLTDEELSWLKVLKDFKIIETLREIHSVLNRLTIRIARIEKHIGLDKKT